MKLDTSIPKPIKQPCDKCYQGCTSYYDSPCYECVHNPHTPDEILENYREDIFKERFDRFVDYKTHVRHCGKNATTILLEANEPLETYRCGVCQKKFITIAGEKHKTHYCPTCGAKIEYEPFQGSS